MNFKGKLLAQLFCNLFQIRAAALGQWGQLSPKQPIIPNGFNTVEFNPALEFGLEPFDNQLYRSNHYVRGVHFNNKRIWEKITELSTEERMEEERNEKHVERRKTDFTTMSEIRDRTREKFFRRLYRRKKTLKSRKQIWLETVKTHLNSKGKLSSKPFKVILEELKTIKNQIKIFRKLSDLVRHLEKNFIEFKKKLSVKLGEISKESEKKITDNEEKKAINENKMANENWKFDGSGFKAMNNVPYNNQYQIDAIFIINRLSEEKEKTNSKFNEYKEAGGEIFNELTVRKMKELLVQALNYLNSDGIPVGDFPNVTPSLVNKNGMDLSEKVEKFSKTFSQQITPKQIDQLAKIIDFVERFHGTLTGFNELPQQQQSKLEAINLEENFNRSSGKKIPREATMHRKVLLRRR